MCWSCSARSWFLISFFVWNDTTAFLTLPSWLETILLVHSHAFFRSHSLFSTVGVVDSARKILFTVVITIFSVSVRVSVSLFRKSVVKCQIDCNGWIHWMVSMFSNSCICTWVSTHRGNPPGVLLWSLWEVQRHGDGAARTQSRGPIWSLWQNLHPQDRPHDSHTAGKSWKMLQVLTVHSRFLKEL